MGKIYKDVNSEEIETTVNVLYKEGILSIFSNKISLEKQLCKILGEPTKEDKVKKSIVGSTWDIPLDQKSKISQVILRANIFEL